MSHNTTHLYLHGKAIMQREEVMPLTTSASCQLYIALPLLNVSLKWCKHADSALITYDACCAYPFKVYLHNRSKIVYRLHCRLVSSFKQYSSPPINAFNTSYVCHAAKCKTSSNQNDNSVLIPQNVQLGIQVIFLQGVTRHMQHG